MWNTGTNWTGSWIAFGNFTKEPLHFNRSAPKQERRQPLAATTGILATNYRNYW